MKSYGFCNDTFGWLTELSYKNGKVKSYSLGDIEFNLNVIIDTTSSQRQTCQKKFHFVENIRVWTK